MIERWHQSYMEKIQDWKTSDSFDLNLSIQYLYEVAEAINFLHTRTPKIIHRDIKPK